LLQLGKGGHIPKQSGANWPQLRVIDLSAQTSSCAEGVGNGEQLLSGSHTSFAATQQSQLEIAHPLEAQASIQETVKACHFKRSCLKGEAFSNGIREGTDATVTSSLQGAGEAGKMLAKARPLEQLQCFLKSGHQSGRATPD
jgi:sulfatase maturation enzyme AslB (radical SAM superfamily)